MRTILKVLAGTALVIVLIFVLVVTLVLRATSDARDLARGFALEVTAGDYRAAQARLHEGLHDTYSEVFLRETFGGSAAYESVSFTAVASSGDGTELEGTARTASGCSTPVSFRIFDGRITGFEMAPLCPK
ncbi:MAG: hypothetical protein AAGB05_08780 [Pseudomonadota bacterium]